MKVSSSRAVKSTAGASRAKTVFRNVLSAGLIKGFAALITVATIPAYLHFFGGRRDVIGLWLAAVSMINWLLTLDLGIGNGARNSLVRALADDDDDEIADVIAGAYGASLAIAVLLAACSAVAVLVLDWNSVLHVPRSEFGPTQTRLLIAGLVATVIVQLVLRVVSFVFYALQLSAVNNLMALATSASLITFVYLGRNAFGAKEGPLVLCAAYFVAVNGPLVLGTLYVFRRRLRGAFLRSMHITGRSSRIAVRSGRVFFLNQILYTMLMGTSTFFVAAFAGAAQAFQYQVYYTVFSLGGVVATLALTPFWSAVTQAQMHHDYRWIQKYLRLLEMIGIAVFIGGLGVAFFIQPIFDLWLGDGTVRASFSRALVFAAFGGSFVLHGVVATFASGLGKLRLQVICYSCGFIFKLLVAVVGTRVTGTWVVIPLGDFIVMMIYYLLERISLHRRIEAEQERVIASSGN